jgi:acetolactate synthase-1/2/3 large subunit
VTGKTVSTQIAEWLTTRGIERVFGVTGGGAMFLNQALGSHAGLRCLFMHHEQACAMAAEGYARISAKPAAVMVTTGPGAINALNGVYGAFTDSIPMLVIAGQIKRETCLDFHDLPGLRQLGDQEGPAVHMARHICKFAEIVRDSTDLEWMLPKALALATSGRPGPVWLDIPLDIQSATDALTFRDPQPERSPMPVDIARQVGTVVDRLLGCNRPLILAGTGVRVAGVRDRLLSLIERLGIPMATAWTHDLIPSDHPLFAGRPGTIGTRPGNFALQAADLVLVVGSRLNIRQTSYNFESFAKNAWVCQVDIDSAELTKPTYHPDFGINADLADFLNELERQLATVPVRDFSPWSAWTKGIGEGYSAVLEHKQIPGRPLNPYLVVDQIFEGMRADDIVVCGNASACILPFQIGRLQRSQRMFSNSGSASMGYDLPAAIGAAMVDKRRVICFAGDGSLQMNIQELQTLKTTQANVIVVVLNNAGYLSIWQTHENFFGRVIGATPATGVEFPDFNAVATAYSIPNALIREERDIERMAKLLQHDGPMLLNVIVDPRQEFAPRIKSRIGADGKFVTPELDDMHPFLDSCVVQTIRASGAAVRSKPAEA